MTVQGNGATTSFSFQFLVPVTSALVVTLYDTTVTPATLTTLSTSSYSVTGIGVTAGGTVTYPLSAPPYLSSGQYLNIYRVMPLTQTVSIANQGNTYPAAIEGALDKLTFIAQQVDTALQAVEDTLGDEAPLDVVSDFTVGTLTATTASVGTLTATTATIYSMTLSGPQFDTSINVRSVTSGQTVTLASTSSFTPLTLTQTAAALTVNLPASPVDGQKAAFSIDQNVTVLTVSGNGATLKNAPVTTSTQSSGSAFGWVYDSATPAWFRDLTSGLNGFPLSYLTTSAAMSFGATNGGRSSLLTATVTGSVLGDFCQATAASNLLSGGFLTAMITSNGVVTVFFNNLTGASVTPGSVTVSIIVYPKSQFGL